MMLEEDKRYVTRTLQIVHKTQKNGRYYIGQLLERKDWKLEFESNGECVTHTNRQSVIEQITARQSNHGIYSDFELSVIRSEDKKGTCTINKVYTAIQLKIKEKKDRLNNCLGISQYL